MADNVRNLLNQKAGGLWTVSSQDTVYFALQLMAEKDVGALLVVDEDSFVGIVTERDYARKCILKGKESRDTLVEEIMVRDIITVRPNENIDDCMRKMSENNIRHLPVVENGRLIGVVSIRDVVGGIISGQKAKINDLQSYISGRGYGAF